MTPMETPEIGTLKQIPTSQTNPSSGNRRRVTLRSQTVDTLFRILSICSADPSPFLQYTDKDGSPIGSETKDVRVACTDTIPNDLLRQKEISMDEITEVVGSQGVLCNTHVESPEQDHNISGERKDLSHRVDTDSSNSIGVKNQDNYDIVSSAPRTGDQVTIPETPLSVTDMMISSAHLLIDKDVEEGEISGELMASMPEEDTLFLDKTRSSIEDFIGIEPGLVNNNSAVPLSADTVDGVGRDMAAVASKTVRNLVDYSEVHGKTNETGCASIYPERVLPLKSNLKSSATKNKDFASPMKDRGAQNNKRRQGSCTEVERTNKKAKYSVDATTSPEDLTSPGDHPEDASQEVVDASVNKDADDEKRKKRVRSKEGKAKKKRKERIRRAEKNRKLGVKRLKLQPVIKEKKITYCRHYLKGRCQEGEKCKFSHDTIPLTKSMPCCHFARHACMKGNDCPYDHQLSKYPCNNYQSKGFCSRGSDCMFSHEARPSESPLNAQSKPEQNPSSLLNKSGSKMQNNIGGSCEKPNTKHSSLPERNLVEITPKLSARPPKGIVFLSQGKLPLEPRSSPRVDAEVKASVPGVVQDSKEITKTPLVTPRGINFLSFGKQHGLDHSKDVFSFKMGNGIGKSPLSKMEGEGSKHNDKQTNSNIPTDAPTSTQKPMHVLPFMSITSRRALQSTVAFASNFVSGVKTNSPGDSSQKL